MGGRSNGLPQPSWRRRLLKALFLVLVGVTLLWRLGILPTGPSRHAHRHKAKHAAYQAPPVPPNAERIEVTSVQGWLAQIPVKPEKPHGGYNREDWPHWLDLDGNCRDTRTEVLIRDSLSPVQLSSDGCRVLRGRWRDLYTGEEFQDPHAMDIDHRVALEEAYDSGGSAWDRDRRKAYANDLSDPRTLVPVSAAANRAKGAKGPEAWLPPDHRQLCRYVADWVAVKLRWRLSMDRRERATIDTVLSGCRSL